MTDPHALDLIRAPDARLLLRRDLIAYGSTDRDIRNAVREKSIERIHRGSYLPTSIDDENVFAAREERYRSKVVAAVRMGGTGRFPSHQSAAALLGIPLLQPDWSKVHFLSERSGRRSSELVVHQTRIFDEELTQVDGITTTGIGRTVCDIARDGTLRQAICALDSGLYQAHRRRLEIDLDATAMRMSGAHGIGTLRAALKHATHLAESVGESLSHCVMLENPAIPEPELQVKVVVADGSTKWCDTGWRDSSGKLLVVGEFDGRFKYHRESAASGRRLPEDVIYAEKLREDAIRDCGIIVVRWTWRELARPDLFEKKILAALRRAGLVG